MNSTAVIDNVLKLVQILTAWPIMLFLVVVLFRKQISGLLPELSKRLKTAKVAGSEFEFAEPETVETPLGKTEVSIVPTKPNRIFDEGLVGMYSSKTYSFQISWPGEHWHADLKARKMLLEKMGLAHTKYDIPVVITKNEPVEGFYPSVNVVVEPIEPTSLSQYMASSKEALRAAGLTVLSSTVDEATQAGLLVSINTTSGKRLYQFQRVVVASRLAYVVTATQLPPEDLLNQQVRDELASILNSFALIR